MSYGLEVYDASGNVILTVTDRITRLLGTATFNASGSVTDARFADGTPWWFVQPTTSSGNESPDITFSGTTLSWSNPGGGSFSIIYGIY